MTRKVIWSPRRWSSDQGGDELTQEVGLGAGLADTLVGILTVREMLLYTAELKRPMHEPFAQKQAAVNHILEKLSLEDCQNVIVGTQYIAGISGGQVPRPLPHPSCCGDCKGVVVGTQYFAGTSGGQVPRFLSLPCLLWGLSECDYGDLVHCRHLGRPGASLPPPCLFVVGT